MDCAEVFVRLEIVPPSVPAWNPICGLAGMRTTIAVLICLTIFTVEAAQQPHQYSGVTPDTLSVTVDRVNVLFTVADGRGKFVRNLLRDDFRVYEDDRPQDISNFSTETNLPLNIAFLIDSSGSVRDKLHFERQAAAKFFSSALRPGKDKALVMSFDTKTALLQDYTDNPGLLSDALQKIIAGGSTCLYDAVFEAAVRRLAEQPGRRVIVVLSDGMDNSSHISLPKTLEAAQKNNVIIYAVSTNGIDVTDPREQKTGDANLNELAKETGGRALFPSRMADLERSFSRVSDELRSQYSLAYGPTNMKRDGTYRRIRIVALRKRYNVRCRHGYYAPDLGMARSDGPS
jgi:Ca-activated chloride channel family protein